MRTVINAYRETQRQRDTERRLRHLSSSFFKSPREVTCTFAQPVASGWLYLWTAGIKDLSHVTVRRPQKRLRPLLLCSDGWDGSGQRYGGPVGFDGALAGLQTASLNSHGLLYLSITQSWKLTHAEWIIRSLEQHLRNNLWLLVVTALKALNTFRCFSFRLLKSRVAPEVERARVKWGPDVKVCVPKESDHVARSLSLLPSNCLYISLFLLLRS